MKVNSSSKTSVYGFVVLILLLFSCLPVTLLTYTGAEGSNLSGVTAGPPTLNIGGQLKNCRITSTDADVDTSNLQQALSNLVMDVSDAGLVTAECEGSYVDKKYPGLTNESLFQARGNNDVTGLHGTFNFAVTMSGQEGTLKSRLSGSFKSANASMKAGSVAVHFIVIKSYVSDANGNNEVETDESKAGKTNTFDATFDAVGFSAPPAPAPAPAPAHVPSVSTDLGVNASSIRGQVEVWPGAHRKDRALVKLKTVFHVGDHIRTREDSTVILNYVDMSQFVVPPNTEIVLEEPPERDSKIQLITGKFWTNLKSILPGGEMDLDMTQAVCGIKGTILVCETTDTTSTVKVIEGNVEFTSKANGQKMMVEGGKTVTATASGLGAKTSFDVAAEKVYWDNVRKEAEAGDTSSAQPAQSSQQSASPSGSSPLKLPHVKIGPLSCFIATAAYGSQTAEQLDTLRAFRDRVLMKSEPGRLFVETYYYLSPPLADFIADKDALRAVIRFELLDPIVFILQNSQQVWNN